MTPEVQAAIVAAIEFEGAFRTDAAALAGISPRTLESWFALGQRDGAKPEHVAFVAAVLEAEARLKARLSKNAIEAAAHHPKLGLTFLSRRFPAQFGRRDNVEAEQSAEQKAQDAALIRETILERFEKMADALAAAPATVRAEVESEPEAGEP